MQITKIRLYDENGTSDNPESAVALIYLDGVKIVIESASPELKIVLEKEIQRITHLKVNDTEAEKSVQKALSRSKSDIIAWLPLVQTFESNSSESTEIATGIATSSVSFGNRAIVHSERPVTIEDPEFLGGLWHMLQRYSTKFGHGMWWVQGHTD